MFFFTLGLLLWRLRNVSAMMCLLEHPQSSFIRSQFVLSGKIEGIEESVSPFEPRKLNVNIYTIYKQPDDSSKVKRSENLEVRIHDQWMKKEVRAGEEYLLAGALYNGRYIVTGCDWVQKMYLLSPVQRWGLKRYYQRNKECEVKEEGCENGECCLWKTKDLAAAEVKADCTSLKAICMKSPGGKCHWFRARIGPSCVE
uniref:Uncharacterized protein n=1 Tax=Clytia hemisphaerica TaxID=252671 RepID=A0A7M5VHB3_9CNID|eukprot:TCONS_00070986-protein